jgi:anti-anti-sigma factor
MVNDLALRLAPVGAGMCLTAVGHLDGSTAYLLGEAVGALLARRTPTSLIINVSAVRFLDRRGVDMLRQCHRDAVRYGVAFAIDGASPLIRLAIHGYGGQDLLATEPTPPGCVGSYLVRRQPDRRHGDLRPHPPRPPSRPRRHS